MRRLLIVGAAMLVVLAGAFATNAGSGKAALYDSNGFTCSGGATETAGATYGFTVINAARNGVLQVDVSLKGATADATYDIYVNQDPGGCPTVAVASLKTNGQGNGSAHVSAANVAGAANYWISAVGGGQVLRSTAVQTP